MIRLGDSAGPDCAVAASEEYLPSPRQQPGTGGLGIKRAVDLVVACLLLAALAPVETVIALALWVSMGRPILFAQRRPGRDGRPFVMQKFRTMTDECDKCGGLLPDAQRLTRLGRALRATSLDELPQLFNVIKGDMSLVGPRPLLMAYLPYFTERERMRFAVRPGITGWAQINGRNTIAWDDRLALDSWYVLHRSLVLDLRIAGRTIGAVLGRRGFEERPEAILANLDDERRSRTLEEL
jgi:sugar transferase EpsL